MKDLLLNEDGSLKVENGSLVIGDSEQQHVGLLLSTGKGQWRSSPLTGANLINYIKSVGNEKQVARAITIELKNDLFKDADVKINADKIFNITV